MKCILVLALCVFFLTSRHSVCYSEVYKGYFITTDGKTQVVGEFKGLKTTFLCKYNGNDITIPVKDIKKMMTIRDGMVITKRNGKEFKVWGYFSRLFGNYLVFTFYDKINEKYSVDNVDDEDIKELVFDDDFGEVRKCPKCEKTFPPDYMFCPYDKTEMKLVPVK